MTETTTDTRTTGPVIETVTRLILHCSRCNAPFKDDDYDQVALWTQKELDEAFPADFDPWTDAQGWIRLGDSVLCPCCWKYDETDDEDRVEVPPLDAAEADRVARARAQYFQAERHVLDLSADSWTIKHPLSCRPNLFDCPVNQAAERDLTEPPAEPGRYLCDVDGAGCLVIGNAVGVVAP